MEKHTLPARDQILSYLRRNRGKEVPVSELASNLNLKRSTISNAIKELNLQGHIEIERRSLKRGRYTVVYLTGDLIQESYVHKNEIIKIKRESKYKKQEKRVPLLEMSFINEMIYILKSPDYNPEKFFEKIESRFPKSIEFITDFVTPLMHEVGIGWTQTNLSTAEEHIISNRVEELIIARMPINGDNQEKGTIILVPVEGERHVISLLSLEYIFRDLDYKIINLGRSLPIESLVQYIKDLPDLPDWIFMSITLPTYLGTIRRNLDYLHDVFKDQIHFAIGGQGISENERNFFPLADIVSITKEDLLNFIDIMN